MTNESVPEFPSDAMIKVFSLSEPGGHAINEDAFRVQSPSDGIDHWLCVIADGQGGQAGGARAAQVACETCLDIANGNSPVELLSPEIWIKSLEAVDEAVCAAPGAGYTTIAALCLANNFLCGASCGDSAVVLLDADEPGNVLTARQYKNPPVGSGDARFIPFAARFGCTWVVLAMSDGVWKYAGWDSILKIAKETSAEDIIPSIRARAQMPNGELQDDFTLVVLQKDAG